MAGEKTEFWMAPKEVEQLADTLIRQHHPEALDTKICFLMRNKHFKFAGKVQAGYCRKQSEEQKTLHDYDFVITLAADIWSELGQEKREALLLHEIKHVGVDVDDEGETKMFIRPHDTEEFADVIKVYGLWSEDLSALAAAIEANRKSQ